jgi:ATP-dependent RNA helicase DDX55/SPB4
LLNGRLMKWDAFSYADPAQEVKRVAAKAAKMADNTEDAKHVKPVKKKVNTAWSKQAERKDERELRREKKNRKRKWLKANGETSTVGAKELPQKDSDAGDEDDWEDLAREERMAKKLKRGEIDQDAFDAEFGEDL